VSWEAEAAGLGWAGPPDEEPVRKASWRIRRRSGRDGGLGQRSTGEAAAPFGSALAGERGEVGHPGTRLAWCWLGAHGGAGVTTLAAAADAGIEASRLLPGPHLIAPLPVVVVTRGHASGLVRAQEIAAQADLQGFTVSARPARVVGLALVADAPGHLPKPLAELRHLVAGGYLKVWPVPWVEAWRLGDPPNELNTPNEVRRMLNDLRSMTWRSGIDLGASEKLAGAYP
jgi:hypothetical protein